MKKQATAFVGVRFEKKEKAHLLKRAGKNGTVSDFLRALVRRDMRKVSK